MPNPKRRHSVTRRDKRRAHWKKLDMPTLVKCDTCEALHMSHHVCPSCGSYAGKKVIALRRGQAAEA